MGEQQMFTNTKLSKAIRLAAMFGAASATAFSANVVAQEAEAAEEVEKITVTGSRIKRTDVEAASPVTFITMEDMKDAGRYSVADALRSSTANQFGSFSEASGSGAQSQATVSLLGAGSQRTLVLMDGKRIPGSPSLGGTSVNLNQIPMSIVERIEINRDGGSAVYGSDAIAGVINIITKKDYEGANISAEFGRPSAEGADTSAFSFTAGVASDKGSITFALEHQKSEEIFDADRSYTQAQTIDRNGDGIIQAYSETIGTSWYGATVVAPDFAYMQASPLCDQYQAEVPGFLGTVAADDDWSAGSTYCMYQYANVSANKASVNRTSAFVNATYDINENTELFSRFIFAHNESFGRYAPPAAQWRDMPRDNVHIPQEMKDDYPDAESFLGLFRWFGIGNRDNNIDDYTTDILMGVNGTVDDSFDYEVYAHYSLADNKSVGEFYQSISGLAYNQANGIDLGSEEGQNNLKATTLDNNQLEFMQYNANATFEFGELAGGTVGHAFGVEYMDIDFVATVDAQSEAGLVGGSAGNSSGKDRQVFSAFYETILPVSDDLEVNFAVRYDDYSDFGGQVSPKLSAKYNVSEDLSLRASIGNGFRAPTLQELSAADAFSAESATDYVQCKAAGTAAIDCPSKQYDTTVQANKNLEAEESTFANVGVVYNITDDMSVTADLFNLEVTNVIEYISVQDLIFAELVNNDPAVQDPNSFTRYTRQNGLITEAFTSDTNAGSFDITGLNIDFQGQMDLMGGELGYNLQTSYFIDYSTTVFYNGPLQNTAGWGGAPELRSQLTLNYSTGNHTVAWNTDYTDSTYEISNPEFIDGEATGFLVPDGSMDAFVLHGLSYTYDAEKYGRWTLGARNLLDEGPVLDSQDQYVSASLYINGHIGRVIYAGFSLDL